MVRANFSGGWGHNLQLDVTWGVRRQDIADNYTMVNVSVHLVSNAYVYIPSYSKPITVKVNGSVVDTVDVDVGIGGNQDKSLLSKDYRIDHLEDGSKEFSLDIGLDINVGNYGSAEVIQAVKLPSIPRASSGNDVTAVIGQPVTINIDRKHERFTHSIWVRCENYEKKIAGDDITTSYVWTPEMALCKQFPNTSSGYGQVTIITYDGSREIGRDVKRLNLSVPDNVKPTLTGFTLTDTNTAAASVVPGEQAFIQILSNIKVNFGQAMGAYGSTITGYYAEIVGKNQSTTTQGGTLGIMNYTGNVTIRARVIDSRGRTSNTIERTVNILEYFAPILNFDVARSGAQSSTLTITRNAKVAPLAIDNVQKNQMKLTFKVAKFGSDDYKVDTGSASGTWTTVASLVNSNANLQGEYAANSSWTVLGILEDKFTRTPFSAVVTTEKVAISYSKDRIGFGKIAEIPEAVDSAWEYYFKGEPIQNRKLTNSDGRSLTNIYKTVDEYVTTGFYYVDDKKLPDPVGGYLLVESYSVDFIKQTYTPWNKSCEFTRQKRGKDKPWSAWVSPALEQCYPIGSIYQSTEPTNPSTFMGGVWERFGNGRVLVGVDETDADFNAANKQGGAKMHKHDSGTYEAMIGSVGGDTGSLGFQAGNRNEERLKNSTATYRVKGEAIGSGRNFNHFTEIAGQSAESSNLQPYVTIYRWRRIA
jgi:hypothetical protein